MTDEHHHHQGAPIFSAPDHDHASCAADMLARAEQVCAKRQTRLTPLRRQVLEALAATHAPIGAYELIGRLEEPDGKRPAPITVYRALDFLLENGLAHRIESRNAFIACAHEHDGHGVVMFLICESCGTVGEAVSDSVGAALDKAARGAQFRMRAQVVEIAGLCSHCEAKAAA